MRTCARRRAAAISSFCCRTGPGASSGRRRQYRQRRANQYAISASTLAEDPIAAAQRYEFIRFRPFIRPRPNDDVVVGDARPADESGMAVERRFRLSDTNRNVALKSEGERE
jgi:hypothetical protein